MIRLGNLLRSAGLTTISSYSLPTNIVSYSATFSPDCSLAIQYVMTLTGDTGLMAPINNSPGSLLVIVFIQNAAGSHDLVSADSCYKFPGGYRPDGTFQ
ncbi:MAG: hypothetical protein GY861_22745, partial [bacterium]|nr:hypothetical protein [bacterium]